jgi:RNA-directed DNA polymerase
MIDYYETKEHPITKKMILDACKEIKANGNAAGVDGQRLEDYAQQVPGNLYKLWNRMTSGSYMPSLVKEKKIPKKSGGTRSLGIPTVEDRIAQQVIKKHLEWKVDASFHPDSYGYRRGKNAHQALNAVAGRCHYHGWVLDLDIKSFFDTIDHDLMMKGLQQYTNEKWVLMYVERWLKAGILQEGQGVVERASGTPQGGVLSPLLANIYLHFAFDMWLKKYYPQIPFARYCDDAIVHCKSEKQAVYIRDVIARRMKECKLELNMDKTQIVYCRNELHRESHKRVSFDFLGHSFQPGWCRTKSGGRLLFQPVMSRKAKKSVMDKIRQMRLHQKKISIQEMAALVNTKVRGWMNYYCEFNEYTTRDLWWLLNLRLIRWVRTNRKFNLYRAVKWLKNIYKTQPKLFAHWAITRP